MTQMVSGERKSGVEAVTQTAIAYQLLCQYTAFVAVSDEVRVEHPEASVSVQVPVEMPEGVSAEGIFGSLASAPIPYQAAASKRTMAPGHRMPQSGSIDLNLAKDQAANAPEEPRLMYKMKSPPSMPQRFVEKVRSLFSGESSDSEDADFQEDDDLGDMELYLESPDAEEDESLSVHEFESGPRLESLSESRQDRCYAAQIAMPAKRLEIVSVTGLEAEAIALLTAYLQSMPLPPGVSGELVWELRITQGRVKQVILDDEQSSGDDPELVEAIRRSLFSWRSPHSLSTTVLLRVRISA